MSNRALAEKIDVRAQWMRAFSSPSTIRNFTVNVDRTRAASVGLTQANVGAKLAGIAERQRASQLLSRPSQRRLIQRSHSDTPQCRVDTMAALPKPAGNRRCKCGSRAAPLLDIAPGASGSSVTKSPALPDRQASPSKCWGTWPTSSLDPNKVGDHYGDRYLYKRCRNRFGRCDGTSSKSGINT